MTYSTRDMLDHSRYGFINIPWRKDTLRIFHTDDRQYWSVSEPGDPDRANCLVHWRLTGEFFDGKVWRPLRERAPNKQQQE